METPECCPNCGGNVFSWGTSNRVTSGVVDGRLRAHEVEAVFHVGCDYCSETLKIVTAEEIVKLLNAQLTCPPKES